MPDHNALTTTQTTRVPYGVIINQHIILSASEMLVNEVVMNLERYGNHDGAQTQQRK